MKHTLLLLICAIALGAMAPAEGLARGNAWKQKSVVVYDYSGSEWNPLVQDAVNRFNVLLPKHAPMLVHRTMTGSCKKHKKAITVCVVTAEQLNYPYALAVTTNVPERGEMQRAFTKIADYTEPKLYIVCHELFHAMGVASHGPWVDTRPCPYDPVLMDHRYGHHDRKHR